MKKVKLFCVAPYKGMQELMQNIAERRDDVEMIIRVGDLCSGMELASEDVGSDVDAIISRGGSAEILRSKFQAPTIEVKISVYDVLRAIGMARNISANFVVVGFPSVARVAQSLCEMLQYDVPVYTVQNSNVREQMRLLKEQGCDLVVGDTSTVKTAMEYNINGILFTSGIESIEEAINSAVQLCRYHAGLKSSIGLLTQVISNDYKKSVVYDSSVKQCFSTTTSIPDNLTELMERNVPRIISGEQFNTVRNMDGRHIFITGKRIKYANESYSVYELRENESFKTFHKQGIRYYNAVDLQDQEAPENYLGGGETVNTIMGLVNRFSVLNQPVLIDGEIGCGMDLFASYIYRHSTLINCVYVVVDCSLMNDASWEFLMASDNSPFTEKNLTIYMKHMECASLEQQIAMITFLKDSLVSKRNRLLFSYTISKEENLQRNELYSYILESMSSLVLHLPPLRLHKEDIPVLMGLAINANNQMMGTQVIGFMPEAVQYLQEYAWEHNVDQLRRVVREVVSAAVSPYIALKDVKSFLQTHNTGNHWRNTEMGMNLNRTLDEIVQDIVLTVFQEEKMNQSQTAKRLGISRSTLWRLMKRYET